MENKTTLVLRSAALFVFLFSVSCASPTPSPSPSQYDDPKLEPKFLKCLIDYPPDAEPISGAVFTKSNASFQSVYDTYARNLRVAADPNVRRPLAIVTAQYVSHILATVICSQTVGIQVRIRSGGHDYEGLSYVSWETPFVILDMYNFRSIEVNLEEGTAWVQAGATTGELYYAIAKASRNYGFPAGVCTALGTGGHFSGGGYGNMMRKYGLSVDNIVDANFINVKGELLDRKSMGEDLFWAIRGGGGASFGVILSWKIKLVPVPDLVTVFSVARTIEEGATDIVLKWQEIVDTIDDDLFLRLILGTTNTTEHGDKKTVKATFIGFFLGQTPRLLSLLNESFPELGLKQADCSEMSWVESTIFYIGMPKGTPVDFLLKRTPYPRTYFKRKSDYVKKSIPKAGLEKIWKKLIEAENVSLTFNPSGGMMARISESATPFPHRAGNKFMVQYATNWANASSTQQNLDLTNLLYDAMTPYVSHTPREAFLNYRDLGIGVNSDGTFAEAQVYGIKYFKGNFRRLVQVKTAIDPEDFFKNEQSIPTCRAKL